MEKVLFLKTYFILTVATYEIELRGMLREKGENERKQYFQKRVIIFRLQVRKELIFFENQKVLPCGESNPGHGGENAGS